MKVKLFTHTDMDGVGPVILAKKTFAYVDYDLCNYGEINEKVQKFMDELEYLKYDMVFITDISVNEEVANIIDQVEDTLTDAKFVLIDHHSTAQSLNKYPWANVHEIIDGEKTSGTSMFWTYLLDNGLAEPNEYIDQFAEQVRRYDSWEWTTKYDDNDAKRLNDLLYIVGQTEFIRRFTANCNVELSENEKLILDIEEKKIEKYIKSKEKQMIVSTVAQYKVGIIFSEFYVSQLGNEISKLHPELDLVIMLDVGAGRVSYRTTKDDVNVAELAKTFGGGGHPKSSGSEFNKDLLEQFTQKIFA